jgi:hypothetical protein
VQYERSDSCEVPWHVVRTKKRNFISEIPLFE